MKKNARRHRHPNENFSPFINLVLADVLMSGILGMIFLGVIPEQNEGLSSSLAPYHHYETQDTLKIPSSNILHLDLDAVPQVFVDGIATPFSSVEKKVEAFVWQHFLADSKCYLWIRVDRAAKYRTYIQLRDIIKSVERSLLDDLTIRFYGTTYSDDMPFLWRKEVKRNVAICIIEEDELGRPSIEVNRFCDCWAVSS